MRVDWKRYKKIMAECDYRYFGRGAPFGAIRIYSVDDKGSQHSLVLSRNEFKKYFREMEYNKIMLTDGKPTTRLMNVKAWYEYEDEVED